VENDIEVGTIELLIAKEKIKSKERKKQPSNLVSPLNLESSRELIINPNEHPMTSFSWSDPVDTNAGPGS